MNQVPSPKVCLPFRRNQLLRMLMVSGWRSLGDHWGASLQCLHRLHRFRDLHAASSRATPPDRRHPHSMLHLGLEGRAVPSIPSQAKPHAAWIACRCPCCTPRKWSREQGGSACPKSGKDYKTGVEAWCLSRKRLPIVAMAPCATGGLPALARGRPGSAGPWPANTSNSKRSSEAPAG